MSDEQLQTLSLKAAYQFGPKTAWKSRQLRSGTWWSNGVVLVVPG